MKVLKFSEIELRIMKFNCDFFIILLRILKKKKKFEFSEIIRVCRLLEKWLVVVRIYLFIKDSLAFPLGVIVSIEIRKVKYVKMIVLHFFF